MTLKAQMAADVSAVIINADETAEAATYTPAAGGSSRPINVVIDREELLEPVRDDDGQMIHARATAYVDADATLGVASPANGDSFVVAGVTWRVRGGHYDGEGMHVLRLVSFTATEKSGAGWRIDRR